MDITRRKFFAGGTAAAVGALAIGRANAAAASEANRDADTPLLAETFESPWGRGFASDAVRAGEDSDCSAYPIYQGTTNHGQYTRGSNPTINSIEVKIKSLEGGEWAVATASGMAAISHTLFTFLRPGSRIVTHRCVYGGTQGLLDENIKHIGVDCRRIDMRNLDNLRDALKKKTDIVYFEVHSNPTLEVVDVAGASKLAKEAGAMVIVDNTWLSPYLMQPLDLGADIVLHSATKYLMGHGMGLGGIVVGPRGPVQRVTRTRLHFGGIMSPMNAFLLHQGIKTLPMRMERHCANAQRVAEFLESHPKVAKVHYPGLKSDPGYGVDKKQLKGFGGMVGMEMKQRPNFFNRLKLCRNWTSLGDVQTLITPYGAKPQWGIPDHYVRMSIGVEDPDDIIADIKQAMDVS